MTLQAVAFTTYDMKGGREDLADIIYNISPEETPLVSMLSRKTATATLHEWQTDALAAAVTNNAQLEGDAITTVVAATATTRVGNYMQIMRKTFGITGTEEVVKKAGRQSEVSYQTAKKGAELKLDQEATVFANIGGNAGNTTTARTMATLGAWLKTNTNIGTGAAADPVWTAGVPAAGRVDGTQRAFTETIHKDVLAQMFAAGAKLKFMFTGPVNKAYASAFAGVAVKNYDLSGKPRPTAIIGAADVYVSEFGYLSIIPTRSQRERDVWYLDPDMLSIPVLRPMERSKLPLAMDGEPYMILMEASLRVNNEAAHGLAADLNTT